MPYNGGSDKPRSAGYQNSHVSPTITSPYADLKFGRISAEQFNRKAVDFSAELISSSQIKSWMIYTVKPPLKT